MNDQHTKPTPRTSETPRTDEIRKLLLHGQTTQLLDKVAELERELSDATRRERERCARALVGDETKSVMGSPTGTCGLRRHICGSCCLSDDESNEINGWNSALHKGAEAIRDLGEAG